MNIKKIRMKKAIVYSANYLARPLGNLAKDGLNVGHPYAALGFGLVDVVAENSGIIKDNLVYRLTKVGGAAYFSFLTFKNLVEFAQSDYHGLKDFPFNLSMAASLGSDLKELYNKPKEDVFTDIKAVGKGIANLFK